LKEIITPSAAPKAPDTIQKATPNYPVEKPTAKPTEAVPANSIFYDIMKQYGVLDAATGRD
jgi:hypothetical protein